MSRPFVVAGPTGSGKTALAIALALRFDAVIVSVDAMQVYRGLDIGTAKATPQEQGRVPHFGIDVRAPAEPFDAAMFVELADDVTRRHPRVILAGGTSLYLHAWRRGLVETPPIDALVRAKFDALPDPHLELQRRDPALAERLHPNDRVRILRGLEVHEQTGRPLSALHNAHARQPDRHAHAGVWLDHPALDGRLDARVLSMMKAGYLDEVAGLLDSGVPRTCKPMRSLGYRHLCDHLAGELPIDEAVRRTQRDTRRFARKQRTWLKKLGYPKIDSADDARVVAMARAAFEGDDGAAERDPPR